MHIALSLVREDAQPMTDASSFAVTKVSHHLVSPQAEYVALEFLESPLTDAEVSQLNLLLDLLTVGVIEKDIGGPVKVCQIVWRDSAWRVVDSDIIAVINKLYDTNIPPNDLPDIINKLI